MASRPSGYRRVDRDKYYTDPKYVHMLLDRLTFIGPILDPCAGGWHIVGACRARGYDARGYDIHPLSAERGRPVAPDETCDFIEDRQAHSGSIITNPPTGVQGKLGEKFVAHALDLTKGALGMVAMFMPDDFDSGSTRRNLFADHKAFLVKLVVLERPRWINLDQKQNGPRENYAWYVWDWLNGPAAEPGYGYLPGVSG